MKSVTLKVGGITWGLYGIFPLFNMCTRFFLNPSGQVVHDYHLVLREKNPTQIGHHMWVILAPNLAPPFEQHMESPPKTSNANLTKFLTCMLKIWGFYILFWSTWLWEPTYTSRHLFIYVDCHLPGCKPCRILGGHPFRVAWVLNGLTPPNHQILYYFDHSPWKKEEPMDLRTDGFWCHY